MRGRHALQSVRIQWTRGPDATFQAQPTEAISLLAIVRHISVLSYVFAKHQSLHHLVSRPRAPFGPANVGVSALEKATEIAFRGSEVWTLICYISAHDFSCPYTESVVDEETRGQAPFCLILGAPCDLDAARQLPPPLIKRSRVVPISSRN